MSTPEEKAALRKAEREKRQNRIKASGTNRLAQITGAAGSKDFKPAPVTEHPQPQPSRQITQPASPYNKEKAEEDPFFQFLKQSGQSSGDPSTDPLLAMLAGSKNGDGDQAIGPQQQQHFNNVQRTSKQRADTVFWWDIVHFVVSISLGLYAGLSNPWSISTAFLTIQVVMLGTQSFLGHQNTGFSAVSMLAPLLGMLPKNRQRQLSLAGGLINAARSAYRDMAIVLFIYGCVSLGGRDFERPIAYQ